MFSEKRTRMRFSLDAYGILPYSIHMTRRRNTRIDMHVHTPGSDGFGTPEQYLDAIRRAGLDGIAITDHHATYTPEGNEIAKYLASEGVLVVRGGEYSSAQGHILVYGVALEELKLGYYADAQTVIARVHEHGGLAVAAHPYHGYKRRMGHAIYKLPGLAGVETRNGNCEWLRNTRMHAQAHAAAKVLQLPTVGGSDAHSTAAIGRCWTQLRRRCTTEAEVLAAIRAGACCARTEQRRMAVERREQRQWQQKLIAQHQHTNEWPTVLVEDFWAW